MKCDLKGRPKSYKTNFLQIRLWTDFDENLYECQYHQDKVS